VWTSKREKWRERRERGGWENERREREREKEFEPVIRPEKQCCRYASANVLFSHAQCACLWVMFNCQWVRRGNCSKIESSCAVRSTSHRKNRITIVSHELICGTICMGQVLDLTRRPHSWHNVHVNPVTCLTSVDALPSSWVLLYILL
jgi:hypothetical protein